MFWKYANSILDSLVKVSSWTLTHLDLFCPKLSDLTLNNRNTWYLVSVKCFCMLYCNTTPSHTGGPPVTSGADRSASTREGHHHAPSEHCSAETTSVYFKISKVSQEKCQRCVNFSNHFQNGKFVDQKTCWSERSSWSALSHLSTRCGCCRQGEWGPPSAWA